MPQTPPLLVIVGPTASGKTALGVELARQVQGEVISADSRQVYRFMDIGTAKPTLEEREGVPHHGFDIVDPDTSCSAGWFAEQARRWIEEIQARRKWPIIVGGSGLYLQALIDGFFDGEDIRDEEIRAELDERLRVDGLETLYRELERLDPIYAKKTLPNDRQRILRALEVSLASGQPFSELHNRPRNPLQIPALWFGLNWERNELYARIDSRVHRMLDSGLIAEVRSLLDRGYGGANALKSVGYEEIIDWIEGRIPSLEEAVEAIATNSRRYAKRQLTWFRRDPRITWLDTRNTTTWLAEQIMRRAGSQSPTPPGESASRS